jgi:hypothetical protein
MSNLEKIFCITALAIMLKIFGAVEWPWSAVTFPLWGSFMIWILNLLYQWIETKIDSF